MKNSKITFIGGGNMAQSLVGGMIQDGLPAQNISITDLDINTLNQLVTQYHVTTLQDNQQAINDADVIVLAVKPMHVKGVLSSLKIPSKALIVSIAAGILIDDLNNWSGNKNAIVRCMPNTPALVQCAATGLFANQRVSKNQKDLAESILRAVGLTVWLQNEQQLDAVTALSGSGPAYYFLFMEAMQKAAEQLGLSEEQAQLLTIQTAFGAAKMALESSLAPSQLRENVTSKNGTTEQALKIFKQLGLEDIVNKAMQGANDRSVEIGKEMGGNL